ncbi:hypothetical protein H0H81_004017 [Sphagnurus paluster]|uniref:Uncharacterized protein n=1 Tax=Sphagnurus paluster TaxID=117069 RepID=A0A9P7GL85_9AGAR|nr:hypothetical protein H0H81_004017 [Sphagnurus paluster]
MSASPSPHRDTSFTHHIGTTNPFFSPSLTMRLLSSIARAVHPSPTMDALYATLKHTGERFCDLERMPLTIPSVARDEMLSIKASLIEIRHRAVQLRLESHALFPGEGHTRRIKECLDKLSVVEAQIVAQLNG